jgi:hypothetical protein
VISNLTLPECRSLSAASWDLEKDDVQADPKGESGKASEEYAQPLHEQINEEPNR